MSLIVELRQAFLGDAAHGPHGQAEAVGEDEPLVDPGLVRQVRVGQLPRGQHDLQVLVVHGVAVVVHILEVVVGPDLLQLAVGLEQRLLVPEPDVLDRGQVLPDIREGQLLVRGKGLEFHVLQAVAKAGELDMACDIGQFEHALVRRDLEALDRRGIDLQPQYVHANKHGERDDRYQEGAIRGKEGYNDRRDAGEHGHDRQHYQAHMHISVRRAVQHAVLGSEQAKAVKGKADREAQEEQRHQDPQVSFQKGIRGYGLARGTRSRPGENRPLLSGPQ